MAGLESRSLGEGRVSVPVVGPGTWRRLEAAAAAGRPASVGSGLAGRRSVAYSCTCGIRGA